MSSVLAEMKNITKSFHGVQVLKGIGISLDRGQVVSIIGTNGAGKSTLTNILAGIHQPDSGTILIDGKKVSIHNPKEAEKLGICMVHQEPTLCENMKVYENLFLNSERTSKIILDRAGMREESRRILNFLGFDIDVDETVENLSLVAKGIISIAKAMLLNPKILILDEITAPLSQHEVDRIFEVIRGLREEGLNIIYISHKIKEIVAISDEVVILKDGEKVGRFVAQEAPLHEKDIIHLMLGETEGWSSEYSERDMLGHQGEVLLEIQDLCKDDLYEHIDISLHRGEIIGMAGLKGSGITELMFSIFGVLRPDNGLIRKAGRPAVMPNPQQAIKNGVCMITNDRQREGAALILSVEENIAVASLAKMKSKLSVVPAAMVEKYAREYIQKLNIKTTGPKQAVQFLSGGNQQKVVVAKWLLRNSDVILIDEPTRGIDVKAKNEIYDLLVKEKMAGKGIIVFSPETRELLNICDRILIMIAGAIEGEFTRGGERFTEKDVLEAMHST